MKTETQITKALEVLTETTVWGNKVLTGPRPGCSDALMEALFGLEITRYGSGNIKSALLNGNPISNNRAFNLQTVDLTSVLIESENTYVEAGDNLKNNPIFHGYDPAAKDSFVKALEWHQLDEVIKQREEESANYPLPLDLALRYISSR